jgi:hypothetical protein
MNNKLAQRMSTAGWERTKTTTMTFMVNEMRSHNLIGRGRIKVIVNLDSLTMASCEIREMVDIYRIKMEELEDIEGKSFKCGEH